MDTNGKAGHIEDEHQPTVAMRLVCTVFPLQDQPEHDGCEGRGVGIDLTLDSGEPECVGECVNQSAHQGGSLYGDGLGERGHSAVLDDEAAHQMRDGPEEEHDTNRGEERTHNVDHTRHLRHIAGKLAEKIGREGKEWCPRWVADFELVARSDKLWTVPEAGCRLNGGAIDERGDRKNDPSENDVHQLKLFHERC